MHAISIENIIAERGEEIRLMHNLKLGVYGGSLFGASWHFLEILSTRQTPGLMQRNSAASHQIYSNSHIPAIITHYWPRITERRGRISISLRNLVNL